MLRIGEISYLNCTPIFSALRDLFRDGSYSFVQGAPSLLNGMLARGEIDVCPSSSIEYGRNPDSYVILPDLSISAAGAVMSVLLFSRRPLERLDGCSIALTSESATSVALLKIILSRMHGFGNSYTVLSCGVAEALADHDAVLLIGDRALQESLSADGCKVYDLGSVWQEATGLPFVFALWLARKELLGDKGRELRLLSERLKQAKKHSLGNLQAIAGLSRQYDWTNPDFLINYWRVLSYDLTQRHLDGLALFFRYAAECGVLPGEPDIHLLA